MNPNAWLTRLGIAIAAVALLCNCAIVTGRNKFVDLSGAPSDTLPSRLTEGYYYRVLDGKMDTAWASQIGDSCLGVFPLLLLKDGHFAHLPGRIGGTGCGYPNKTFETMEEGHAQLQTSMHRDSLPYSSIDGWGRYSLAGNEIAIGVFTIGDMFSFEYSAKRGRLGADSLILIHFDSFSGVEEFDGYHFRPFPINPDYNKIPLKKKRFKGKLFPPVWFWWES